MNSLILNCIRDQQLFEFEDVLMRLLRNKTPLATFVDGGAYLGGTSLRMVNRGAQGSVCYAFEPYPPNLLNFKHGRTDPRIILIPKALGASAGTVSFDIPGSAAGAGEGHSRVFGESSVQGRLSSTIRSGAVTVQVVRADDEIPSTRPVDFVKLDLKGGEHAALVGMPRILEQAKLVYIKLSRNLDEILSLMTSHGYQAADTLYFFTGADPRSGGKFSSDFLMNDRHQASTGLRYYTALRAADWPDYVRTFERYRRTNNLFMTNILFIKRDFRATLAAALNIPSLY